MNINYRLRNDFLKGKIVAYNILLSKGYSDLTFLNDIFKSVEGADVRTLCIPSTLKATTSLSCQLISVCPYKMFTDITQIEISYTPNGKVFEQEMLRSFLDAFCFVAVTHEDLFQFLHSYLAKEVDAINFSMVASFKGFRTEYKLTKN